MDQNKPTFQRFWAQNKSNLLIGLIASLICCIIAGRMGLLFPIWVWGLIALVCWCGRTGLLYLNWKRENTK